MARNGNKQYQRIGCVLVPIVATLLLLFGIAFIVVGLIVIYKVVPDTVHDQVIEKKSLGNDVNYYNELTTDWVKPNYASYMQYWVYNYTNVFEVQNSGANPVPQEKGPYAYRETIINQPKEFIGETVVAYETTKTYVFDATMSCDTCRPDDLVTFPDILLYTFLDTLLNAEALYDLLATTAPDLYALLLPLLHIDCSKCVYCPECLGALQTLIDNNISLAIGNITTPFNASAFTTQRVDDLLFTGYVNPIIREMVLSLVDLLLHTNLISSDIPVPIPPVAINANNDTGTGVYYILTGKDDIANVGQILNFDATNRTIGSDGRQLSDKWWNNPDNQTCPPERSTLARMIRGTTGDFFKPFISKNDQLYMYVPDICRSLYLEYTKDVTVQDIDGYRFIIPTRIFEESDENCGFCHPPTHSLYNITNATCLPGGLLDISRCQYGKPPIAVSNPHFFGAKQIAIDFVDGQKPTADNDQTYIDIEPTTGTVLVAHKRLQINLIVHAFSGPTAWNAVPYGAYPIVWLDESFIIDQKTRDQLYDDLIAPQRLIKLICWICVGIGAFVIVIATALMVLAGYCCRLPASETQNMSYANITTPTIVTVSDEQHRSSKDNSNHDK